MGVSRRSIVFGRGKRLPSEEDCAENTLRIINPTILSHRQKQFDSPTRSPNRPIVSESGGEDDSRDNPGPVENSIENPTATDIKKTVVTKRKTGTFWNFDEAMIFYEALKEHGKNFEQIASILNKKKFSKDKDQTRNFFYNTYKLAKDKISIVDQEWVQAPQTAKELLIVINALEWRKRTRTTNLNAVKFKNLLINGCTTVKVPGKRIPVSVRTPNCAAIHKFFPSLKQSAKIPNTLKIHLIPYSYASRRYVLSCEQNPLLTICVNTQSPLSTLFRFLEQKWQRPGEKKMSTEMVKTEAPTGVIFYPIEGFKPSKILIQPADDAHPSIKNMRLNESKATSASNTPTASKTDAASTPKSLSNTFEVLEEQLNNGLTVENSEDISFLHLYYLFNQQSTINLRYDLITNVRSSNVFIKLSELIRNSEGIIDNVKAKKRSSTSTPHFASPQPISNPPSTSTAPKRLPNFRMANEEIGTGVVDNEREQFKQQLMALRRKTKNQQKSGKPLDVPANKRVCTDSATGSKSETQQKSSVSAHDSTLEETQDSFGFTSFRPKNPTNGRSAAHSSQRQNSSQEIFEDVVDNETTRNSLLPSPLKLQDASSLGNEMYRYFVESMASQSSSDAYANFSQLVNTIGNESNSQTALE